MSAKKKVLIVDDDSFILDLLDRALSSNYESVKCNDGNEALEEIKKQAFDAVITDIVMPEKDGVQLISEMRAMNIQTPVIAISGDAQGQNADNNLDFACYFASEILKKPIKKDEILKVLDIVIGPSAEEALKNL